MMQYRNAGRRWWAVIAALALPGAAGAADDRVVEFTPIAGWQVGGEFRDAGGDNRDLDETAVFGAVLNLQNDADSQWELYLSRQSTDFATDPAQFGSGEFGLDVDYYHLGGNVSFDGPVGRPFVAATLGATRLQPDDGDFDSTTRFSFSIGTGLKVPFNERVGARLELRGFATLMDNDSGLFCLGDADGGFCAVDVDGRLFWQVAATAGLTIRFR